MSTLRDIEFLKATLGSGLLPDWTNLEVAALRRLIEEDLTRKMESRAEGGDHGEQDLAEAAKMSQDATTSIPPSSMAVNGRFILLSATQELNSVLETAKILGMRYQEVKIRPLPVAHVVHWKYGSAEIPIFVCVAVSQRVDALASLIQLIISAFSPKSIMLAGMMGGIPGKIGFLDVVAPTAIYDGRVVGTRAKKLTVEPESAPVHPSVHLILNNIAEFRCGGQPIVVKKNKKSITVAAKIDDITHKLFKTIILPDRENIVGFEMEGQAVVNSNLFQQLSETNVIMGMMKGVADFGGMQSGQSVAELDLVRQQINYSTDDGDFDPIENKKVKEKLQKEATRRAFVVAAEVSVRVS